VVDDGDVVGQRVGLVEVLRGEQDCGSAADQAADEVPEVQPGPRVESGRRLVEEQDARPPDQARRQVEPAPHAA
jgi:hypothetical protein